MGQIPQYRTFWIYAYLIFFIIPLKKLMLDRRTWWAWNGRVMGSSRSGIAAWALRAFFGS